VILTDSNILVHSVQLHAPEYRVVDAAIAKLRVQEEILCIAPQNVVEFWSVVTRPVDRRGMGLTPLQAAAEVNMILRLFQLLPYQPDVLENWRRLVLERNVSGKQVHDAHLVAMMQAHSITSILTFNGDDFERYPGITALNPAQL
jgi:predicted nucleic acid-binding protein